MLDQGDQEKIKKGIKNPRLALDHIYNRVIIPNINRNLVKPIYEFEFERKYGNGINVLSEDWDNLIILDCLRYDIFKEMNTLEGDMGSVISKASKSLDFVKRNFEGKNATDCVYVTANGWNEKINSSPFFTTAKTYDSFNERLGFYHPEQVYELSVKTFDEFQNKRYIIHFMQPHAPYLGAQADKLREKISEEYDLNFSQINQLRGRKADKPKLTNLQEAAELGYITLDELKEVYIENIEVVLPYVKRLHSKMGGKTVVTADHGELLGERKSPLSRNSIGHPGEIACRELRQVPWLVLEHNTRRETQHDPAIDSKEISDKQVEDTLEALGYLN